jgi:hypothetical protein
VKTSIISVCSSYKKAYDLAFNSALARLEILNTEVLMDDLDDDLQEVDFKENKNRIFSPKEVYKAN